MTTNTNAALLNNLWEAIGYHSAQVRETGHCAPGDGLISAMAAVEAALSTTAQRSPRADSEEWEPLAYALCAEEHGEDACHDLILEGGPIPEPWGDRWMKYESEAKRLIGLVRTHVPSLAAAQPPAGMAMVPAEATEEMKAAAVKYANGTAVYKNVSVEVLRIEESIYGEIYEAMLAAAPNPHVQIPTENVHIDCDVSKKAEKVDTSAASKEAKAEQGWRTPTTYQQRFSDAITLLCRGARPTDELLSSWMEGTSEELQSFACEHGPAWAQGIGLIDAADVMADQPTEGVDHKMKAEPVQQPERVPLTDEQINKNAYDTGVDGFNFRLGFRMGARFAERAHGIQPAHKEQPND